MKTLKKLLKTIRGDRLLLAGCIGILILLFIVVAAPAITKYDAKFFGPDVLFPPGSEGHFLGTNHLGQDIWSMLIYGTRTSLMVGRRFGLHLRPAGHHHRRHRRLLRRLG